MLLIVWAAFALLTHLALVLTHQHLYKYLFHVTAVLGMICMAFAFGQNDLANAASPGLSGYVLWQHGSGPDELADLASKIRIPLWALFGCGLLMAGGMFTSYAQRVTRAEVNTGSQFGQVALYAPEWCKSVARLLIRLRGAPKPLVPETGLSELGKKIHYDTLRASVITAIGASVIAFASGRGLPVSTTYVAFAAVLGTGLSDRVFVYGDADTKLGRAVWVVFCWFLMPVIAILCTGCVAWLVYNLSAAGLVVAVVLNLSVRHYFRNRADAREQRYHTAASQQIASETPTLDW